jgi:Kelch motif
MKKQINSTIKAHLLRSAFYVALLLAVCVIPFALAQRSAATKQSMAKLGRALPMAVSNRTLTFAERVSYQRAIEGVYWRHRIWPKQRDPKPSLDAVMSQTQIETKVGDYLRNSRALEDYWHRPISAEQLQAEMDRMAQDTKQPEVLRELFEALGNDPFVIAECLVRSVLVERLLNESQAHDRRLAAGESNRSWPDNPETQVSLTIAAVSANYALPVIASPSGGCTDDMWTPTSVANAPVERELQTAVWTGSEMIIWGGDFPYVNTGGRYNPGTDSWTATNTTNAPAARSLHTAVWTGGEMIVWGGFNGNSILNTGGRYNPVTDSWTATSLTNAPTARDQHTAVWTGSEMIIWGGDNGGPLLNTGGRYNPSTDSWVASSNNNAPAGRFNHTAVWTGSEMIVWGGHGANDDLDTGGRYSPPTNSWAATNTVGAPVARENHTAVWTDSQMIIWGGFANGIGYENSGGRYCAQSGAPTPTPTPTATASPTSTATPTATPSPTPTPTPCTGRCTPTPRPRPTPPPRP